MLEYKIKSVVLQLVYCLEMQLSHKFFSFKFLDRFIRGKDTAPEFNVSEERFKIGNCILQALRK